MTYTCTLLTTIMSSCVTRVLNCNLEFFKDLNILRVTWAMIANFPNQLIPPIQKTALQSCARLCATIWTLGQTVTIDNLVKLQSSKLDVQNLWNCNFYIDINAGSGTVTILKFSLLAQIFIIRFLCVLNIICTASC